MLADAGLLAVLTAAFFSLVPIDPLPGKAVASYKKALSVVVIVLAGILLYGFMLRLLPSAAYLITGVLSGVVGGMLLYKTRKSTLAKEATPTLDPRARLGSKSTGNSRLTAGQEDLKTL